ncbi:MAG: 2Fe-2S iron-sulfur cluster binding domain-containing protein, partial [Zoogloeaceae bacterium]|nr:2Fe-2S iron-sulfur cluster binding domain-containing protein [Zoogloeaceae bacterium]
MTHQISVRSNGLSFAAEADETLLEAALRQGLTLPYGCRSGACGACRGHIEHGEIDPGPYKPFAISEADIAAGAALFCCARAKSDLVVEAAITRGQQIEAKIIPVRVEALTLRAPDVMEILLCLPANETFPFLAGQFVDFLLPEGKRRSYSIANAPEKEGVLELHVRKVPGGHFTEQVFSTLKVKDVLRLEGPQGGFFLRESDKPAILLASGTGFAPIKAIVEHALATGDKRAFHLFWGCRKEADLYHDLPQRWAREYPLIR